MLKIKMIDDRTPIAQVLRQTVKKRRPHETKSFCTEKDTINQLKGKPIERGKCS